MSGRRFKRMLRGFQLTLILLSCSHGLALAWWDEGHEIIAEIASNELTAVTRAKVNELLQLPLKEPGSPQLSVLTSDLISSAPWADHLKQPLFATNGASDPYGAQCHFLDLNLSESERIHFAQVRKTIPSKIQGIEKGLLRCTQKALETLRSPSDLAPEKALALRYLVHLLGDLHQPLHVFSVDSNQGGNKAILSEEEKILRLPKTARQEESTAQHFSSVENLHFYWDAMLGISPQPQLTRLTQNTDLAQLSDQSPYVHSSQVAANLRRSPTFSKIRKEALYAPTQSLSEWTLQSLNLGITFVYRELSRVGSGTEMRWKPRNPSAYRRNGGERVKRQLILAGLRLGFVLNGIFDPRHVGDLFVNLQ